MFTPWGIFFFVFWNFKGWKKMEIMKSERLFGGGSLSFSERLFGVRGRGHNRFDTQK